MIEPAWCEHGPTRSLDSHTQGACRPRSRLRIALSTGPTHQAYIEQLVGKVYYRIDYIASWPDLFKSAPVWLGIAFYLYITSEPTHFIYSHQSEYRVKTGANSRVSFAQTYERLRLHWFEIQYLSYRGSRRAQ